MVIKKIIRRCLSPFRRLRYKHKTRKYKKQFVNCGEKISKMEPIFNEGCKIHVGNNCGFWKNVTFRGDGDVIFGDRCVVGDNTIIFSFGKKENGGGIYFGNDVSIASNCAFYDSDHSTQKDLCINRQPLKLSPIIVEDDVWFGTGCIILRGSTIRRGAVIGAGSLVKGEIPKNAIAVGIPAKVIKYRE